MRSLNKSILMLSIPLLMILVSCVVHRVELSYVPESNGVQKDQFHSSLRFGFITFEDNRPIMSENGMKNMLGWGTYTYTYDNIPRHVTQAFVDQYKYLGFQATQIPPPSDFSFSEKTWIRSFHAKYPDIDVVVIGKINGYQFQVNHTGFMGKVGNRAIQTQASIEAIYADTRSGNLIWTGSFRHRSQRIVRKQSVEDLAGDMLDSTLQRVILNFADRSMPHLNQVFANSVQQTQKAIVAHYVNSKSPQAVNPDKIPIPGGNGRLIVTTVPTGANVYIDQVFYGTAPLFLDLSPGVHFLKIELHGYETKRTKLAVFQNKTLRWKGYMDKSN